MYVGVTASADLVVVENFLATSSYGALRKGLLLIIPPLSPTWIVTSLVHHPKAKKQTSQNIENQVITRVPNSDKPREPESHKGEFLS